MKEWVNTNEWSGKRPIYKQTFRKQLIWVLERNFLQLWFGDEGNINSFREAAVNTLNFLLSPHIGSPGAILRKEMLSWAAGLPKKPN